MAKEGEKDIFFEEDPEERKRKEDELQRIHEINKRERAAEEKESGGRRRGSDSFYEGLNLLRKLDRKGGERLRFGESIETPDGSGEFIGFDMKTGDVEVLIRGDDGDRKITVSRKEIIRLNPELHTSDSDEE